jgi:ATP-dependent Clp protease protease subunit
MQNVTNPKPFYVNLQAQITQDVANKFLAVMESKIAAGATEAYVAIASPGGFLDPAFAVYNFLRGIPIPVTTHNYGHVDSVATLIYTAGKTRLATRQCRFLIHGLTWTAQQAGVVLSEQNLVEILNNLRTMSRNIADVISERTGNPVDKVVSDMSKSVVLEANEAKAYGLVHEFSDALFPQGADVVAVR